MLQQSRTSLSSYKYSHGQCPTLEVGEGGHHGVLLRGEVHEHLHPDLLLQRLHDVGLVLQLLPQLRDGRVRLLLEAAQTPLQLRHLPRQQGHLRTKQSHGLKKV